MSHLFKSPIYLATLVLIVLGIASQKQATALPQEPLPPAKPELINLYFAELNRSHCDHLVVAILQGTLPSTKNLSKEGHVVSMFPPTNDGTRTDTGGGTGSGDTKSLAINHNSSRSNKGTRTDTGGGTGSGDTKSLAISHNTTRSNRGTRTDTGGGTGSGDSTPGAVSYSSSRSNRPNSTDTDEGDLLQKSDVVQCEHCGASCTEPCRCNPSGIGLIFGATDDQLGMMQTEEGFSYITYQTSYGMRAVTLISMGPDSNQILAIAKGWKQDDDCHQDHQQRPPVSVDPNPYAEVGVAHNRTLDYLTPDLNLTLLNLRQGNDKVVRKKPGRTSFGTITLQRADRNAPSDELLYFNSGLFMSQIYRLPADQFLPANEVLKDVAMIAEDGYGFYQDFQNRLSDKDPSKRAFQQLEETILLSPDLKAFNRAIDQQVVETMLSREYDNDQRSLVLGSLSLAKGTVAYWNGQDDIFEGDIIERGNGKFWADLGGFAAGFTGSLIYNNNNGSGSDVNPFTAGGTMGSLASALVGDKEEETGN
ncbi:hypothetical protein OAF34_00150 [Pirellulaceae bacterium]|nr:hypothetical protein [Pirellulaceae bacterium]